MQTGVMWELSRRIALGIGAKYGAQLGSQEELINALTAVADDPNNPDSGYARELLRTMYPGIEEEPIDVQEQGPVEGEEIPWFGNYPGGR